MAYELLEIIKADLKEQIQITQIDFLNKFSLHFGACQYIRNKYLWNKPKITKILSDLFDAENVDDLSYKIVMKCFDLVY